MEQTATKEEEKIHEVFQENVSEIRGAGGIYLGRDDRCTRHHRNLSSDHDTGTAQIYR